MIGIEDEPENTIRVMLSAIEAVLAPEADARAAALWRACTLREFNIGYECGAEPWAFNQGLSNDTLRRIAACGHAQVDDLSGPGVSGANERGSS